MTQLITYEGKTYSFTDDFTDEEISEALSSLPAEAAPAELALEPELPPVAPEPAEGLLDRAGELIEAGARNFAGSSASGVSSALEYFDAAPEMQADLDAYGAEQAREAQKVAPVKALQEAEGVGDVVSSAYEYLAQSAPYIAAMYPAAKVGGALGSFAGPVGTAVGGILGAVTTIVPQFFGTFVGEQEQVKGRKLTKDELESAAWAALGASVSESLITRLIPFKGSASMLRNSLGKMAAAAPLEGLTEFIQETLGILQAHDWDLDALNTPEARYRLTESFLAGAAIGAPIGLITGPFTTLPPPVDKPPPPPPQPEEEVTVTETETEEVLALPPPSVTPTGVDSGAAVEGDPVQYIQDVAAQWPTEEVLPRPDQLEIAEGEGGTGWRIVAADPDLGKRPLTGYFKVREDAEQALAVFRDEIGNIANRQLTDTVEMEAKRALGNHQEKERAALLAVARETATPIGVVEEAELRQALGEDEKRVTSVLAELEAQPETGIRDEIMWDDLVKLSKEKPKLLREADMEALLQIKKPLSSTDLVQPEDILTIAEQQNISTLATLQKKTIRGIKKKNRKTPYFQKKVPVPSEPNFKLFAKRLTGTDDIYDMNPTQLRVLADALGSINKGLPFEQLTMIPIADAPLYTEGQLQKSLKSLRIGDTFVEELGELTQTDVRRGQLRGSDEDIISTIQEVTKLSHQGTTAIFDELVRRKILIDPRTTGKGKAKKKTHRLIRPVEVRNVIQEDVTNARPEARDNTPEDIFVRPEQVEVAEAMEAALRPRLDKLGLQDVELRLVDSLTDIAASDPDVPERQVGGYAISLDGAHLVLLALDAVPADIATKPAQRRKLEEYLASLLNHEIVHILVTKGVITQAEMDRLTSAIETEHAWDWDNDIRSDQTYWEQAKDIYQGRGMSDSQIREEAIANLFRDYTLKKTDLSAPVKSIWKKILNFFKAIAQTAREKGIKEARDLFDRIEGRGRAEAAQTTSVRSDYGDQRFGGQDWEFADAEVKASLSLRGAVPAVISTNMQLAALNEYFNQNARRLQLMGVPPSKWKMDRIIPDGQRVAVRTDYDVKGPLNEGILTDAPPEVAPMTGENFAMQGVHLLHKKSGNPNLRTVAGYDTSVTLDKVEFRVDQKARNDLMQGKPTRTPPALTHGNIAQGQDSTDGVAIIFNPFRQHLFVREDNGMAVKGADQVTLINGRAYARGNIEYWNESDAPTPQERSSVRYQDGTPDYARPSLELEGPAYEVSSLSTLYNSNFPAQKQGTKTIWQIITSLARRARDAWGGPLVELDDATMETVARIMSAEGREALKRSGNAADWYSEDIIKMFELLSSNGYPELKDTATARAAFAIALTVTSINTQVESNMRNALRLYNSFKESGRFPEDSGWGIAASQMRKKFTQVNRMINDLGISEAQRLRQATGAPNQTTDQLGLEQVIKFFNTPFTKAQLVKLGFDGSDLPSISPQGRVYGSYVLGPKLGSFYQNLMGNYDTVTMDKWFMRTWNRITGQLPTEADLVTAATALITGRARGSAKRLGVDLTGAEDTPTATIEAASRLAAALDREWQARKAQGARADQKLGITTQAQAYRKLLSGDEVPGTKKRTFMDKTVRRAIEILGDYNINVQPASFQAIIWYPEQDLYHKMGMVEEKGERSFGAAAEKVLKEDYGVGKEQIESTLLALGRRRAKSTRKNVGDAALSNAEELYRDAHEWRDRTDFIHFHTAKSFRESYGPRFGAEESPQPYKRTGAKKTKFVLADGTTNVVPIEAKYTPQQKAVNHLAPSGIQMPSFVELAYGDPLAVSFFHERVMSAKAGAESPEGVVVFPEQDYKHKRLFITPDGSAGFALDEGTVESLFSTPASPDQQVSFSELTLAIQMGGRKINAPDIGLPELYSYAGFEPVARVVRQGQPDQVYMAFDPNNFDIYVEPRTEANIEAQRVDNADAAIEAQDIAVETLRTGINDGLDRTHAMYSLGYLGSPRRDNEAFWKEYKATYPNDDRPPNAIIYPGGDDQQQHRRPWGNLLWRDLDHHDSYHAVPVDVRLGYHMPTRDQTKRKMNGYGMRHAQEHDADFVKFTDFANAEEALLAFLDDFKTQTESAGVVNLGTREPYVKKMMDRKGGLSWVGKELGQEGAVNRPILFEWSHPGLTVPIKFLFTAYRDTVTGKMTFSLKTAYPVTDRVERTQRSRQGRQGNQTTKAYHPENLSMAGLEGAAEAEEMSPEAQQKLVTQTVQEGGTLTLPKAKFVPPKDRIVRYALKPAKSPAPSPARNALLEFIKANPDGFTVDLDGETVPPSGYAFAPIKGAEIVIKPEDLTLEVVDQLIDYVERVQEITGGDVYAGGWLDSESGNYFLDASMVFDDEAGALYAASAADQIAVFNLGTFDEIRTATGIEGLKQTGVYSPQAHADARTKASTLSGRFAEERPEDTAEPEEPRVVNPIEAEFPSYDKWRGRGMSLRLDQQPDRATLIIESAGERVEVRGHPAVGAVYEGGRLDRLINAIPKRADLSALFAGETRNLPPELTDPVIDALELEEEITQRMQTSLEPVEPEPTPADPNIPHRYRRGKRYALKEPVSEDQSKNTDRLGNAGIGESFGEKLLRILQVFGGTPVSRNDPKSFPHFGQWFRTAVFDRFDPIRRGEIAAAKKLGKELREITADVGAWEAFRMLKRSIGIFQVALTRGVPVYRNGGFTSEVIAEGTLRPNGQPLTIGGKRVDGTEFGYFQIFEPLVENKSIGRPDTMRVAQSYFVARRAARLIQEGRQRLMTMENIITQLAMADTIPEIVARFNLPGVDRAYVEKILAKTVPVENRGVFGAGRPVDFQEIFDVYQVYNARQVQMMVDAGVLSQEMANTWTETADYIPYYRQMAETNNYDNLDDMFKIYNTIRPPEKLVGEQQVWTIDITTLNPDGTSSTIQAPDVFTSEQEAKSYAAQLKRESGPDVTIKAPRLTIAPMLDLLETVTQNSLAAIQTSMANVATQRAVRNLVVLDEASVAEDNTDTRVVKFRVNGEEKAYHINDPAMYVSLTVLDDRQPPILKMMGMPANILRNMVTRTPEFMGSNMMRDTLMAWGVSGKNGVPVVNTVTGFVQALYGSTSGKAIAAAGVWAGHDFQDDPSDAATALRDLYIERQRGAKKWLNPLKAVYDKLGKWSAASDAATRIKVYEEVMKETGNEVQASYEAVEVLNFSARGASVPLRWLTATIPFLNARLQGLDLFYRASGIGAEGFTADPRSDRVKRRFLWRFSTIVASSVGYWMLVKDDEEWQEQEAHTKDNFWILPMSWIGDYDGPPFKFPIPFEMGLMGKVIPERLMGYFFGQETNRDLLGALKRGIQSTLEINPYPQFYLPYHEAAYNYSYFTGRSVEPKSMGDIEPGYRYNQHTSELAMAIGRALNDTQHILPDEFISPMRIDHMIKGYSGTLGTYVMDVSDWAWRNLGGNINRPARSMYEYPVMRRFFAKEAGRALITQAYELMDEVKKTMQTLKKLEDTPGLEVDAMEFASDRQNLLDVAQQLKPMKKELNDLRQQRQKVFEDPLMSSDQKRVAMDFIAAKEQEAVQDIPALRRWAFDR